MPRRRPTRFTRVRGPAPVALLLLLFTQAVPARAASNEPQPASSPTPAGAAPALATHEVPSGTGAAHNREFYESGWFWAAVGAAAFVGGVVFLATRDNNPSTIHLHVEVPR